MAIIIISIIAAFGFSGVAKKKGYASPRFWIYPLVVGSGVTILGLALSFAFTWIIKDGDSIVSRTYPFGISIFSLLLFLTLISRAWKDIQKLPTRQREEIEQDAPLNGG